MRSRDSFLLDSYQSWLWAGFSVNVFEMAQSETTTRRYGDRMPHYRIYALSDHGSIAGGTDAECADDEAAIAMARLTSTDCAGADCTGMEVWSGSRFVGQIPGPADFPSRPPGR
jgi:hypothetical protein